MFYEFLNNYANFNPNILYKKIDYELIFNHKYFNLISDSFKEN